MSEDFFPTHQPNGVFPLRSYDRYQGKGETHIVETQREHCLLREVHGPGLTHFKVLAVLVPDDKRVAPITVRKSSDGFVWYEITGRDVPESLLSGRYITVSSAIGCIEEWLYSLSLSK